MVPHEKPDDPAADVSTAAVLLVGNELLSGKIRDENGPFLARVLRRRGIRLVEMAVVEDDIEAIAAAVTRLTRQAAIVFTSGGVGPTHDDLTLAGVARASGLPLRRNPAMEHSLRAHFGDDITDEALSMADLPQGTTLLSERGWPVFRLAMGKTTVYMLPGVPDLLRAKVEALEALPGELPNTGAWRLVTLSTTLDESKLAGPLGTVLAEFAEVEIGSYPKWRRGDDGRLRAHVQVTVEAAADHAAAADGALARLRQLLPADSIIDTPRG